MQTAMDSFTHTIKMPTPTPTQEIFIRFQNPHWQVALKENGIVQELHLEKQNIPQMQHANPTNNCVGNVYLGKVLRVLPGLQSAFVDVGLGKAAFLHVADLVSNIVLRNAMNGAEPSQNQPTQFHQHPIYPPIEHHVFEGQTLLVQVLKEPLGNKGARLTTQISLAGRYLVVLPQDEHLGISRKLTANAQQTLKNRMLGLIAKNKLTSPNQKSGYIVRTNAVDANDEQLQDDIVHLHAVWQHISTDARKLPPTSCLHQGANLLQRVLRDWVTPQTCTIWIESHENVVVQATLDNESKDAQRLYGHVQVQMQTNVFDEHGIQTAIERALQPTVGLPSGGYIVINPTEALTVIDVNTGSFVGGKDFQKTILQTNLEAAVAIAQQLQLRNIGGIVVVDFIDMQSGAHAEKVLESFKKSTSLDRIKTVVHGFSALGLVELTRKRTRESLSQILTQICSCCHGDGHVRSIHEK